MRPIKFRMGFQVRFFLLDPGQSSWKLQRLRKALGGYKIYLLGSFAAVFGLVVQAVLEPVIIELRVGQETRFMSGTATYRKLVNISAAIYFNVRVFNITNPEAFERGEKLKLEELGPYIYEEKRVKNVTNEDLEAGTITFRETKTYIFRPDLSNGTELDRVNAINFPFLAACTISRKYLGSLLSSYLVSTLESFGESMIMRNVSIGELLFQGMELDPAYDVLTELNPRGYHKQFTGGKFAYLNAENGSDTGEFKIWSGVKGYEKFGQIISWDGKKELESWGDKNLPADQQYCNKLNGSDGSLNPPFFTRNRTLYIYEHHLCRSVPFKFHNETSYEGLPGWEFRLLANAFDGPEKNPENKCFCQDPGADLKDECIDGIYRNFHCYMDAPLVISKPHFLDGDPMLTNAVEGLEPSRDKHDSSYEIEPLSGIFLRASVKLQLVAEVQPFEGIETLENLPHVFVPVVWIEQASALDEENLHFMYMEMVIPLAISYWLFWIGLFTSTFLFIFAMYRIATKKPPIPEVTDTEMKPISPTTTV